MTDQQPGAGRTKARPAPRRDPDQITDKPGISKNRRLKRGLSNLVGLFHQKDCLQSLFAVWGVVTLVFLILQLSGDPTLLLVHEGATAQEIAQLRSQLGFDRPMIVQYLAYMGQLFRLDLGTSFVQNLPVSEIISARVPYTLYLALASLLFAVGIGLPVGIITGVFRGSLARAGADALCVLAGQSMPTFWTGILLIMLFAVAWGNHALFRSRGAPFGNHAGHQPGARSPWPPSPASPGPA